MEKSLYSREQLIFKRLLTQVRLDAGLRQIELAARLNVPQSFVSRLEAGERRVDLPELHQLCQIVGISLGEFVRRYEQALEEAVPPEIEENTSDSSSS